MARPDFAASSLSFLSETQAAAIVAHARTQWCVVLTDGRAFWHKTERNAREFHRRNGGEIYPPVA